MNGIINLDDAFTSRMTGLSPALFAGLGMEVSVDIKTGKLSEQYQPRFGGVIPAAIFSTQSFDAKTINPDTLVLAGAPVGMVGKSGKLLCRAEDVNGDGRADLVCQFDTAQFMIHVGETIAEVVGKTTGGVTVHGQDTVKIVPE